MTLYLLLMTIVSALQREKLTIQMSTRNPFNRLSMWLISTMATWKRRIMRGKYILEGTVLLGHFSLPKHLFSLNSNIYAQFAVFFGGGTFGDILVVIIQLFSIVQKMQMCLFYLAALYFFWRQLFFSWTWQSLFLSLLIFKKSLNQPWAGLAQKELG